VPALLQAASYFGAAALAVLLLAATAFVLGRTLIGELDRGVERWAIPTACGLAVLSYLGLLLGFAGLLRPMPVLLVLAAVHLLGIPVWRGLPEPFLFWRRHPRRALLGAAALFPFAILALYPPTAFDATLYHLPFARGFVASGGVPFLADLRFPVFPQANEMLFALVMLFAPDIAAHGVQWLMTMLTAGLVWAWGRDAFSSPAAGWLAVAVYLGGPIVAYLAGNGYIEAGLTLFATAALYAVRRWRGSGERRWLALSALFAATAADVKYLGLFFLGVVGLTVLLGHFPERAARARWTAALLFGTVAIVALAPWYGRIYAWTGNPFFPFFPRTFGAGPWAPIRFESFLTPPANAAPVAGRGSLLGQRLVDLVRLPWDLVFERSRYSGQPPHSPVYLAVLPLALLAAVRDPRQRRLLALSAAYAFACLALPTDSRYMVPITPLLSLSVAGALTPWLDRLSGQVAGRRRLLVAGLCAGCFLPGWLYPLVRAYLQGPLPLTSEQREAYLSRRQPVYPAVAYLNRTLGSGYTVWALHAENMAYYARGRFLGDWIGRARFDHILPGLRGPEDLHGRLRRLGAGYLLLPQQQEMSLPFSQDAAFLRWFQPVYADPYARIYRLR
jgi:4-amino-4-deoxy-L-arabinose transferase-like glycosyltransferase